jgi:hypothetical protein
MIRKYFCLVVMSAQIAHLASAKEPKEIFNGRNLSGWEGDTEVWRVEDGAIVGQTKEGQLKNNEFLIWKGGDVGDFKLRLQYRIDGGNSGIQYRSKVLDPAKWIVGGYQADIDSGTRYTGILYEERMRGILCERGQRVTIDKEGTSQKETVADAAELQKSIHTDDWNDYVVEARGQHFKHTINGKLMSETTDRDREHRTKSGVLALQVHAGPPMKVQFRKIMLEELEPRAAKGGKSKKNKQE